MAPTVKPGAVPGPAERRAAEKLESIGANELVRVRDAATKWQAGLASLVALVTTVFAIKGPSTVEGLTTGYRIAVAALTLLAILLAVGALLLASRAAHGLPQRRKVPTDITQVLNWDHEEAVLAAARLRWAVNCFGASVLLLATTTGVMWLAPVDDGPFVQVEMSNGTSACGTLVSGDGDQIRLAIGPQTLAFATSAVTSLSVRSDCGE
jgi:hypothetical protein